MATIMASCAAVKGTTSTAAISTNPLPASGASFLPLKHPNLAGALNLTCNARRHSCHAFLNEFYFAGVFDSAKEKKQEGFFERLGKAWNILFPSTRTPLKRAGSNAEIAKQRLRMILIADRCSVSDEAKQKIVDNIVGALADFVEIEGEDNVQLNVSADPSLGTVYSVTVPIRRVKPQYQEYKDEMESFEYQIGGDEVRTVGIRFEYPGLSDVEA